MTDTNDPIDEIEAELDRSQKKALHRVEREIVDRHEGGINHVPHAVVETTYDRLLRDAAVDVREDEWSYGTAQKLVLARCLASVLGDYWQGHYNRQTYD